jgi:GGDEF domain-containing protein
MSHDREGRYPPVSLPMAMISIKRHLTQGEEEATLRRVISLLLNGIATRAVQGDRAEYETFQSNMQRIQETAGAEVAPDVLLVIAGSAVQAFEDYSQRTTKFVRKQGAELQNIISMLTRTVISIGAGSDGSVQRLQEIGHQLEKAVELEDVQQLKVRLDDCLGHLREETERQKTEAVGVVTALQREIATTQERASAISLAQDVDPATGLLIQDAAETLFQEVVRKPGKRYVVTAVVNRMQPINARFGHAVGNQVLRTFKEFFEKQLSPGDRLFRWGGPAVIALLERAEPLDSVRTEVRRMLDKPINNKMFEVGGREVLIPVSAAWSVFMLIPPATTASKQIQTFIASQGTHDYA